MAKKKVKPSLTPYPKGHFGEEERVGFRKTLTSRGKAISLWVDKEDEARIRRLRKATGLSFSRIVRLLTTSYEAGDISVDGLPRIKPAKPEKPPGVV